MPFGSANHRSCQPQSAQRKRCQAANRDNFRRCQLLSGFVVPEREAEETTERPISVVKLTGDARTGETDGDTSFRAPTRPACDRKETGCGRL